VLTPREPQEKQPECIVLKTNAVNEKFTEGEKCSQQHIRRNKRDKTKIFLKMRQKWDKNIVQLLPETAVDSGHFWRPHLKYEIVTKTGIITITVWKIRVRTAIGVATINWARLTV
jgi:hypothetical protein